MAKVSYSLMCAPYLDISFATLSERYIIVSFDFRYKDLHVFQLEHPTKVIEWTGDKSKMTLESLKHY